MDVARFLDLYIFFDKIRNLIFFSYRSVFFYPKIKKFGYEFSYVILFLLCPINAPMMINRPIMISNNVQMYCQILNPSIADNPTIIRIKPIINGQINLGITLLECFRW